MKDTTYYDKESVNYTIKRYVDSPVSYTQYFFGRRLELVLDMIEGIVFENPTPKSLLEIGCADGIVIRKIEEAFPLKFSFIVGLDTSPGMIEVARRDNHSESTKFVERKDYQSTIPKDLVLEVGVANYTDFEEELAFAGTQVAQQGYYILSIAGTNSLWKRLMKVELGFQNFLTYQEYESLISKKFKIVETVSVGLYLPFIWKSPALGRVLQPFLEWAFGMFAPNLFHEKVYLCRSTSVSN